MKERKPATVIPGIANLARVEKDVRARRDQPKPDAQTEWWQSLTPEQRRAEKRAMGIKYMGDVGK